MTYTTEYSPAEQWIVIIDEIQSAWYLRGTTWTGDVHRASKFDSALLAQAGLDKARQFMKAASFKKATITRA